MMEYNWQLNMYEDVLDNSGSIRIYAPDLLAFGIEVTTGGHVFQLNIGKYYQHIQYRTTDPKSQFYQRWQACHGIPVKQKLFIGKE